MDKVNNINIVLVGSNPLPCYVQAEYVMAPNRPVDEKNYLPVPDRQILIYTDNDDVVRYKNAIKHALCKSYALKNGDNDLQNSYKVAYAVEGKGKQAGRIYSWEAEIMQKPLYKEYQKRIVEIQLRNVSDAEQIIKTLQDKLPKLLGEDCRQITFNHTGGTKTMTTYATLCIRNLAALGKFYVTECYLDDADKRLHCYTLNGTQKTFPQDSRLTDHVVLKIAEVAQLYGYKEFRSSIPYFINDKLKDEVLSYAQEILKGTEGYEEYIELATLLRYLNPKKVDSEPFTGFLVKDKKYSWEDTKKLLLMDEVDGKALQKIFQSTAYAWNDIVGDSNKRNKRRRGRTESEQEIAGVLEQHGHPAANTYKNFMEKFSSIENCDKKIEFLTGKWLEAYVYLAVDQAIHQLCQRYPNSRKWCGADLEWSVSVRKEYQNEDLKPFELDVVISIGYEIKIFTITIDDTQGTQKLKYFEALFRGEMISGSHSQVIGVSLVDKDPSKIREDLTSFNSRNYRDTKIWGKREVADYEKLVERITQLLEDC